MGKRATQTWRVLDYMREFGSISQYEAFFDLGVMRLGVMRLASRISDLKAQGYNITSKTEAVKNRYGEKVYIKRYYNESGHGEESRGCI